MDLELELGDGEYHMIETDRRKEDRIYRDISLFTRDEWANIQMIHKDCEQMIDYLSYLMKPRDIICKDYDMYLFRNCDYIGYWGRSLLNDSNYMDKDSINEAILAVVKCNKEEIITINGFRKWFCSVTTK